MNLLITGLIFASMCFCDLNSIDNIQSVKSIPGLAITQIKSGWYHYIPMVEFPNNEYGIAYIGSDERSYSALIDQNGEIISGSESATRLASVDKKVYGVKACNYNTDSMLVLSIVDVNGSWSKRDIYGQIVKRNGQLQTGNGQLSITISSQKEIQYCQQIQPDLILIAASTWATQTGHTWSPDLYFYRPSTAAFDQTDRKRIPNVSGVTPTNRGVFETILLQDTNSNVGLTLFQELSSGGEGLYVQEFNSNTGVFTSNQAQLYSGGSYSHPHNIETHINPLNNGGFIFYGIDSSEQIYFKKFDASYAEQCSEVIITTASRAPKAVIDESKQIAHLVYVNSACTILYGVEVKLSDCTLLSPTPQVLYTGTTVTQPNIQIATADSKTQYLLVLFQAETNVINTLQYFFQSVSSCTNTLCYGCFQSIDQCPVCKGSDVNNREIRERSDGVCTCKDKYYDDVTELDCQPCLAVCATCSNGSTCDTCTDITKNPSYTCTCPSPSYNDTNGVCQPCLAVCSSCSNNTTCNSCVDPSKNSSLVCTCPSPFYNDTSGVCQACLPGCASCSNITQCDTCVDPSKNPSLGCTCPSPFYNDTNGVCQACLAACATCSNSTTCDTCIDSSKNPTLGCTCPSPFFNDTNGVCQACLPGCVSCSNDTTCDSCTDPTKNPSFGCTCPSPSFNDTNGVCQACLPGCASCSNGSTCDTCTDPSKNPGLGCTCPTPFYNDLSGVCQQCVAGCASCSNGAACDTCIDSSKNPSLGCTCPSPFYNDSNGVCQACLPGCQTCSNGLTCIACIDPSKNPLFGCTCPTPSYNDSNGVCQQCLPECQSCSDSTTCDSCIDPTRNPTLNCTCPEIFYLDSSNVCQYCSRQCASCESSPDNCTQFCNEGCSSCFPDGTCKTCPFGSLLHNNTCTKCEHKCLSCDASNSSQCTACKIEEGRSQNVSTNCECLEGFYENSITKSCERCPLYNCQKCDNSGSCLQCSSNDLLPPLCEQSSEGTLLKVIKNGEETEFQSEKCSVRCQKCEITIDNCTSCSQGLHRKKEPTCECESGYHDYNSTTMDCYECPKECTECIDSNICIECKKDRILNNYTYQCECKSGYKEDIYSGECKKCFWYQEKCFHKCPESTIVDSQNSLCMSQSYQIQENFLLILICSLILLSILTLSAISISKRTQQEKPKQELVKNEQFKMNQN